MFLLQVFSDVFDPIIQDYHGISADSKHTSDMDVTKIQGNIDGTAPVHSTRIRVGRSIDGFGLSPGITKDQRLGVENLMKKAFANLTGDLAGTYYPLTGMSEMVRQQLVDDHFLFMSGDPNLKVKNSCSLKRLYVSSPMSSHLLSELVSLIFSCIQQLKYSPPLITLSICLNFHPSVSLSKFPVKHFILT